MEAYYFGCVGRPGHYLWNNHLKKLWYGDLPEGFPKEWTFEDSWNPGKGRFYVKESKIAPNSTGPQGKGIVQYAGGWTCLSFPDRTIDDRPNCVSAFMIKGIISFWDMVKFSKALFPSIWERYDFEVREA